MKNYYVYMMANRSNKVLYTGMTGDLERRIWEHKNEIFDGFSKKYKTKKLVYFEETSDVVVAIEREKQIKKWSRHKKDFLINKINSNWTDLSESWYKDPSATLGMTEQKG